MSLWIFLFASSASLLEFRLFLADWQASLHFIGTYVGIQRWQLPWHRGLVGSPHHSILWSLGKCEVLAFFFYCRGLLEPLPWLPSCGQPPTCSCLQLGFWHATLPTLDTCFWLCLIWVKLTFSNTFFICLRCSLAGSTCQASEDLTRSEHPSLLCQHPSLCSGESPGSLKNADPQSPGEILVLGLGTLLFTMWRYAESQPFLCSSPGRFVTLRNAVHQIQIRNFEQRLHVFPAAVWPRYCRPCSKNGWIF